MEQQTETARKILVRHQSQQPFQGYNHESRASVLEMGDEKLDVDVAESREQHDITSCVRHRRRRRFALPGHERKPRPPGYSGSMTEECQACVDSSA